MSRFTDEVIASMIDDRIRPMSVQLEGLPPYVVVDTRDFLIPTFNKLASYGMSSRVFEDVLDNIFNRFNLKGLYPLDPHVFADQVWSHPSIDRHLEWGGMTQSLVKKQFITLNSRLITELNHYGIYTVEHEDYKSPDSKPKFLLPYLFHNLIDGDIMLTKFPF